MSFASTTRRPFLLVGIDTEGDNQWNVRAREHQTFENIYRLPTLHDLFARHGVRPTYLITCPVARDRRSASVLRALHARGDSEIGAHHHAWETPPFEPDDARRHPYASSLPPDRFERQLENLTDAIGEAVGARPLSYRSGRFGFAAEHVSPLEQAGYLVESSVAPLFYEAHKGGPDFVGAPLTPYFLSYDDARVSGSSDVLEVPVSAGLNRRWPEALGRAYARAPWPYTTKRVLKKLGIAKVLWLRPSYSSLTEMKALARRLKSSGVPVLNVIFHSSEAIVGGSPYNRTESELQDFLARLDAFLEFAVNELDATAATFTEFRARFTATCRVSDGSVPPRAIPDTTVEPRTAMG